MKWFLTCVTLLFFNTVFSQNTYLKTNQDFIELGSIGKIKKKILGNQFQVFGIPDYEEKIKVSLSVKKMDSTKYKSYIKKKIKRTKTTKGIDSSKYTPNYIEITIIDRVSVASVINKEKEILEYLIDTDKNSLITGLRSVVSDKQLQKIKKADTFYLQTFENKQPFLVLFKDEEFLDKISFNEFDAFAYKRSYFCWKKVNRTLKIATIINKKSNCSFNKKKDMDEETVDSKDIKLKW